MLNVFQHRTAVNSQVSSSVKLACTHSHVEMNATSESHAINISEVGPGYGCVAVACRRKAPLDGELSGTEPDYSYHMSLVAELLDGCMLAVC